MLPGFALFTIGFVILFALLASVNALAKSKQFSAFAALASGKAGSGKRALFFLGCGLLFLGACGTFAGVGMSDADRAKACKEMCVGQGHTSGRIGPASNPDPKRPRPACLCEGGSTHLEVPADSLSY